MVAKEPDLASLHTDPRWEQLLALIQEKQPYTTAEGWFPAGDKPKSYHMGVDKGAGKDGGNAATIRSTDSVITGFGTLMQTTDPGKYLGKKIRMSGLVRSKDVANWAGLWLRVDGVKGERPLAFDNMQDRAIKGTTDWQRYEIALDVPKEATKLAFGALLNGTGQIWFDAIEFTVEGNAPKTSDAKTEPSNLGFEK